MTTEPLTNQLAGGFWAFANKLPGANLFRNLKIGTKLIIGFGILVLLALLAVVFSFLGSFPASQSINQTSQFRLPTALNSSSAQADLLRMSGDMLNYLVLGDQEYSDRYKQSSQDFIADLEQLEDRSQYFGPGDRQRLDELKAAFAEWSKWPDRLFELRNDQLEREPAYRLLATDGIQLGGQILIDMNTMIEAQGRREATPDNIALLADMARFQSSFASMLSGLRGYVTTRNRAFKGEYEANLTLNQLAWDRLSGQRNLLNPAQRLLLDNMTVSRAAFLELPDQMFDIMESDRYREDLYLFRTEALPQAQKMEQLLAEMTISQQSTLVKELNDGQGALFRANVQILISGIVALILGLLLTFTFRENIAGPIRRLTGVAERIRGGNLEARAQVESLDEIGTLAETFNNMTGQLRQTLLQVREEKKRADDLLNVVIPIGVSLTSEKDFNRLLENILLEAKDFCHAEAGILYLKENDRLKFVIVRNDKLNIAMGGTMDKDITFSRLSVLLPIYDDQTTSGERHQSIAAHVASTGQSLNIPNAQLPELLEIYGPGVFDEKTDYRSISYLTIPLKNTRNEVVGVLQLINAQDPAHRRIIPFDTNLQQMMESFSTLAVAALEAYIREQSLKQEIQQLRIEIDEVKRQKQVSEIVDSDFFQDLQAKARSIRSRRAAGTPPQSESGAGDTSTKSN